MLGLPSARVALGGIRSECQGEAKLRMRILFQNEHFVAADKPAGWLSVPSRQGAADPRPVFGTKLQEDLGQRLWPVHRLDEEVSGVMLFALDAEAHKRANKWFEDRLVEKTYEAYSEGAAPVDDKRIPKVWRSTLLRGKKRAYESPHGKPAETEAIYIGQARYSDTEALHWHLSPRTGRPHQLRYELAHRGFPIVGDSLYGAKKTFVTGAIALRCVRLSFAACPDAVELGLLPDVRAESIELWLQRAGE
jgi:23S rRNA-/tRNA-specific pseudouridylate synthase